MSTPAILRHRRDTAANWTSNNPVLEAGQIGYETDTLKHKWGDGVTAWNSLSYGGGGGGGGGISDGDKGDITVSSSGAVWTVDNDAITYAKMQNVSAASRVLGRGSAAGAGDVQELTLGTNLSMSGTTLNASGSIGGTTGSTDNAIIRADGTGGSTVQSSLTSIDDDGKLTADAFQFDTAPASSVAQGVMVWDSTESAPKLGFNANVSAHLGVDLHVQIYNQTGSTLTKGQVVRQSGSSGTKLKVDLAQADGDPNSATTIGVVAESISNNSSGFIITAGLLKPLDTNAFNEGDVLWLSATTPGAITNVRPTQPNHGVRIGYCIKKAGSADGIIYVDVLNGFELEELHDVLLTSPVNNSFLVYESSSSLWKNEAPADARTSLGLGTLATQSGTFSGTSSGTNTGDQTITLTGDVTGSGTGSFATTIANGAVSTAKMGGDVTTAGKALLDDVDAAAQRTTLGLGTLATQSGTFSGTSSGTNTGDQTITLTGDVTGSGTGSFVATIANDAVSNAKLANVSTSTIKGRVTAGTGDPEDLTGTQATTLLDTFTSTLKGLAPASGGGTSNFLRADGTWAAPAGGGGGGGSTNVWIPASQWIPRTTNGCGVDSTETTTNRQNFDELLFDPATAEYAQALVRMPSNYNNGTVTARFFWSSSSSTGSVVWGLQARAFADDDALDTAFGTAQTVTDTLLATGDMHISAATSAVTSGGTPAATTPLQFQIYRDATNGSDTLGSDARLLGVEISYTSS